ncbi:MAG: hypothetical protein AABZ39_03860 [Spirochaetota bacterium]
MKRLLLAVATVFMAVAAFVTPAEKPPRGDTTIRVIFPPEAAFISLKRQLRDVDWKKLIYTNELKPKKDVVGYQIGVLFANWSVAAATREEQYVNIISTNIIRLTRDIDIDDDSVLVSIKKRVQKFGDYFKDDKPESYRKIESEIRYIKDELKRYYGRTGNKTIVDQIGFGAWLEFNYIGANGLLLKYNPASTIVFNRAIEIDDFLAKANADKRMANIIDFLRAVKPKMTIKEGKTLSKAELTALRDQIGAFRTKLAVITK